MQENYIFDLKTLFLTIIPLIVLVGSPFLSLHIARKQITATVLSNEKKDWINSLRDNVSAFLSKATFAILLFDEIEILMKPGNFDIAKTEEKHNSEIKLLEELSLFYGKVRLMLDITIESHKNLENQFGLVMDRLLPTLENSQNYDSVQANRELEHIITLTRKVIEESYTSIKQLK